MAAPGQEKSRIEQVIVLLVLMTAATIAAWLAFVAVTDLWLFVVTWMQ